MNDFILVMFKTVLNMSITASAVISVVLLARIFLQRFPKKYSYFLWLLVGFRLAVPFTFSSVVSIFNIRMIGRTRTTAAQTLNTIAATTNTNVVQNKASASAAESAIIQSQKTVTQSESSMQTWLMVVAVVWIVGIVLLLIHGLVSYVRLKKEVTQAVLLKENIYECDRIVSPFVFGVLRPSIYIPFRLSEEERCYILKHEQFHIYRKDYIIKLIAFFLTILHWYNPFVWLANLLMTRDMEMSCDEKVVAEYETDIKTAYSISLLSFATNRRINMVSPLAFGETDTKKRVRHVLNIKRPKIIVGIIGIIIVLVLGIACLTNGKTENVMRVNTELQPDGQSLTINHTYDTKQQAKSYIIYADVYENGRKKERKILYHSQLNKDGIYNGQMNLQILRDNDGSITSVLAAGELNQSKNNVEENKQDGAGEQIGLNYEPDKYTMYARDVLWDDGEKHKFEMNKSYVFATQYLEHVDVQEMEAYPCDAYNNADLDEFHEHANKYAATILFSFEFSDQDLNTLDNLIMSDDQGKMDDLSAVNDSNAQSDKNAQSDENANNDTDTKSASHENDKKAEGESPKLLDDTYVLNQLTRWADAFCDRQGDIIVEMTSKEVHDQFIEKELLSIFDDNSASFGYSSPWPMQDELGDEDLPEELNKAYQIVLADNSHASILYYAMTSDPHYTVWKEDLTFDVKNDMFVITDENLNFMDNIVILEEFQTAYPECTVKNTWMDYQTNGTGKQLNDNALLSSSNQYRDLFAPETAVVSLLNLLKNPNKVSVKLESQDGNTAKVLVHFVEDGSDIEVNMVRPYGEHGIWVVNQ